MSLPRMTLSVLAISIFLALTGCNSIYFYETEKFSLNLEGKPDPNEPISGSFGIKQRVVVVDPPRTSDLQQKDKNGNPNANDNEGLSLISFFDVKKTNENQLFSPLKVQLAFLTGEAAVECTDPGTALQALSAAPISTTVGEPDLATLNNIYKKLKAAGAGNTQAKTFADQLDALAKQADPKNYPVAIATWTMPTAATPGALSTSKAKNSPTTIADFSDLLDYAEELSNSATAITAALAEKNISYSPANSAVSSANDLIKLQTDTAAEQDRVSKLIRNSTTVRGAMQYYVQSF